MAMDASAGPILNIRSGPANNYTILGVIPGGEAATLDGLCCRRHVVQVLI